MFLLLSQGKAMKITLCAWIVGLVLIGAVVSIADGPPVLYTGGDEDGYDSNVSTNSNIPPLPPSGTVICIR